MKKYLIPVLISLLFPSALFSADISIPELELVSRLYGEEGSLLVQTRGSLEMAIDGGYKFGGKLKFGIDDEVFDDITTSAPLVFRAAEVSLNEIFGLPFSASYYTGTIDDFCNGDIFHTMFGTGIIEPRLSGFMAFGDGVVYNGLHSVAGTGISFSSTFGSDWNYTAVYLYQDAYMGDGYYGTDIRSAFNLGNLKLETFAGVTFPSGTAGTYRGGLLLYFKASETGSFYAQVGIPEWTPVDESLGIDLFYFLFEPRLRFGIFGFNLSFFWHPAYYKHTSTNEEGSIDLLVDFSVGDLEESPVSGGISSQLSYNAQASEDQFETIVSPYFSAVTSGVIWNFKLNATVLPFDLSSMFEGYIGVKAGF